VTARATIASDKMAERRLGGWLDLENVIVLLPFVGSMTVSVRRIYSAASLT